MIYGSFFIVASPLPDALPLAAFFLLKGRKKLTHTHTHRRYRLPSFVSDGLS